MFNFLLGVANQQANSEAVTKEQFTELENGIYERMKDVQDIARNVQADQISFLNTNITIFLTVAGLIIAIVSIMAGTAINRIRKANEAAEEKMNTATLMMSNAQSLAEKATEKTNELDQKLREVDQRLEDLNKTQVDLKDLLDSKELEDKIKSFEKAADSTFNLEKNVQTHFKLQYAGELVKAALDTYKNYEKYYNHNRKLFHDAKQAIDLCEVLSQKITGLLHHYYIVQEQPDLTLGLQHYERIEKVNKEANKLSDEATAFYRSYIMPAIDDELRKLSTELEERK